MVEVEQLPVSNPVGERLKAAREAKDMSLEEIAAHTRIPVRHLQAIDDGDWDSLPAATYSVGFARSYAKAVGLDGTEVGTELREQLGAKPAYSTPSYYEPADPSRVPPRSLALIAGAIAILLAIGYMIWRGTVVEDDPLAMSEAASVETQLSPPDPMTPGSAGQPLGGPSATTGGPVILTAASDVWVRVYEADGGTKLFENTLRAGESFEVPSNASRPQIRTGAPEALRVSVGQTQVPPLGPTATTITDVSLLPADLLARAGTPGPTN